MENSKLNNSYVAIVNNSLDTIVAVSTFNATEDKPLATVDNSSDTITTLRGMSTPNGNADASCTNTKQPNGVDVIARLPSGFKFKPTDAMLIDYYLAPKILGEALPDNLMNEVEDFYSSSPEQLTQNYLGYDLKNPTDWYFFTKRYPKEEEKGNGVRAAGPRGSWHPKTEDTEDTSTTADTSIYSREDSSIEIGYQQSWVYYELREDYKEHLTEYVMTEYRTTPTFLSNCNDSKEAKKGELVLCKIYKDTKMKKNAMKKNAKEPRVKSEWFSLDGNPLEMLEEN